MLFRHCHTAALVLLLVGACAAPPAETPMPPATLPEVAALPPLTEDDFEAEEETEHAETDDQGQLPLVVLQGAGATQSQPSAQVERILEHARTLIGTRYRRGGTSATTGFDCSGFVRFLFHTEAGIDLPHSTRDLYRLQADNVERAELIPGDVLLFNRNGKGKVSHAGIYLGDGQFIHASSRRSGGVRIDSLSERYWNNSYLTAKRILE